MSLHFHESGSLCNVEEYVDPQYTVKRHATTKPELMTPEPSPTDAIPRRESFAFSEDRSTSFCGSSAGSSFLSYSGCGTPSLSTPGSSASNSRRQSILVPEGQQYYFSATSPSPSHRPQRPIRVAVTDQYPLQELSPGSYTGDTDIASLMTDGAVACATGGEFPMVVDDFIGKAPRHFQSYSPQPAISSLYGSIAQDAQIEDMANDNYAVRASHTFEFNQPLFGQGQPLICGTSPSQPDGDTYDTPETFNRNVTSLGPPFEYDVKLDTDTECVDEDIMSDAVPTTFRGIFKNKPSDHRSSPRCDSLDREFTILPLPKYPNRRPKQRRGSVAFDSYKLQGKHKNHRCQEEDCDYACNRPEHLKRHELSKHGIPEMLPCEFAGCKDRKTGMQREIVARPDNLKAHYTKTHFRYGSSEKGGKNHRKSMKAAHEIGLSIYDPRWTMLLHENNGNNGNMNVNHEIKDFLHVWKMLGYSILETKNIRVKDIVSDWSGPEDTTLQKFDPRWKALWDGTLTFDKAINVGRDMEESEAQGLLGVTMLETEAMGIKHLDPRWTELLSERMSVEQSEKLGVKQRNPVWRRRARL